jgi:hypothetical protein
MEFLFWVSWVAGGMGALFLFLKFLVGPQFSYTRCGLVSVFTVGALFGWVTVGILGIMTSVIIIGIIRPYADAVPGIIRGIKSKRFGKIREWCNKEIKL